MQIKKATKKPPSKIATWDENLKWDYQVNNFLRVLMVTSNMWNFIKPDAFSLLNTKYTFSWLQIVAHIRWKVDIFSNNM